MDKKLKEQINTFIEDNELDLDTGWLLLVYLRKS